MIKSLTACAKSCLTRPHKAASPCDIPCLITLAGLPPELILSISDFLPIVDLICFSLCNHRFFELSQRQIKRLPPRTKSDTLSILNRLERDIPEYFACDVCNILHQYDGSESFGLSGLKHDRTCRLPCVQSGRWFDSWHHMKTHYKGNYSASPLSFLQLKLAMKRFHYGPRSGISTESLSYTQVRHYPMQSTHPELLSLFSREAQICPEPLGLYIRMQDIVLVENLDDLIFYLGGWDSAPLYNYMLSISKVLLEHITPVVRSLYNGGKVSFTHTCQHCNTESHIEIGRFESKIAVIMTRWVNLGLGLTQKDILRTTNVDLICISAGGCIGLDDPKHLLTNSRLCFEEMAPRSFQRLRSRNLSHLRNRKFENGMPFTSAGPNLWYIPYKEPSKRKNTQFLRSMLGRLAMSRENGTVADRTRPT